MGRRSPGVRLSNSPHRVGLTCTSICIIAVLGFLIGMSVAGSASTQLSSADILESIYPVTFSETSWVEGLGYVTAEEQAYMLELRDETLNPEVVAHAFSIAEEQGTPIRAIEFINCRFESQFYVRHFSLSRLPSEQESIALGLPRETSVLFVDVDLRFVSCTVDLEGGPFWGDTDGIMVGHIALVDCDVGYLQLPGWDFLGSAYLSGCEIGLTYLASCVFHSGFTASDCTFMGSPSWREFEECRFDGGANFSGSSFDGAVSFADASFSARALFAGVRFVSATGFVSYENVDFICPAVFLNADFEAAADFSGAEFLSNALFSGSRFGSRAVFDRASFNSLATFDSVEFARLASYQAARFAGDASFASSRFYGTADFTSSRFLSSATVSASFYGPVRFDSLVADSNFELGYSRFFSVASLAGISLRNLRDYSRLLLLASIGSDAAGYRATAREFYYRHRVAERGTKDGWLRILELILVDWTCGYGTKWTNVLLTWLCVIFIGTLVTWLGKGIQKGEDETPIRSFWLSLYFCIVTFTTLGYGDYRPRGAYKILADVTALLGAFMVAVFVLVFASSFMA